ncbi:MAG: hypothetical protein WAK75_04320 [Methanoregula sp.]|uniref:hypothetical protein n=1 Tax=Methanoregula sp. TaxID=2052170 RepID=UPI003BB15B3C
MKGLLPKTKPPIDRGTFWKKDKRPGINKRAYSEKPMTVCIAAICDSISPSPKIVFASDRLVSAGVSFESGVSKSQYLTPNAWIMSSSNDALASDGIILKIQKILADSPDAGKQIPIEQIANMISQECKNKIRLERENQVFSQFGINESDFAEKSIKISTLVVADILNRLREFKYQFEVEFLVIGFDFIPAKNLYMPHIYSINELGDILPTDHLGFATSGSGKYLAFPEITKYAYQPNTPLSEAVLRVYWSKKIAERVGGVGKETDLLILHAIKDGVKLWIAPPETKKMLDDKLEAVRKDEIKISLEVITELNNTVFNPVNQQNIQQEVKETKTISEKS